MCGSVSVPHSKACVFVASRELAALAVCAEAYVSIVATLCACVCCAAMSCLCHCFGWEHLVLGLQSCYFSVVVFTCLRVHCTPCACSLTCVCCALTMRSVHVVNESYIQPNKISSSTDLTTCTNMCNVLAPFWGITRNLSVCVLELACACVVRRVGGRVGVG